MSTSTLGDGWLKFMRNVLLPLGVAGQFLRILVLLFNSGSLPSGYIGAQTFMALIGAGLCVALFVGLRKLRPWAWYLLLAMVILSPVGAAVARAQAKSVQAEVQREIQSALEVLEYSKETRTFRPTTLNTNRLPEPSSQADVVMLLVVGLLAWSLPNCIYFYRRRSWFGISLDILSSATASAPKRVPSYSPPFSSSPPAPRAKAPPASTVAPTQEKTQPAAVDTGATVSSAECPCGKRNPTGAQFCGACGRPVRWACPECAAANDAISAFCQQCGLPRNRYQATERAVADLADLFAARDDFAVLEHSDRITVFKTEFKCELALHKRRAELADASLQKLEAHLAELLQSATQANTYDAWNKVGTFTKRLLVSRPNSALAQRASKDASRSASLCRYLSDLASQQGTAAIRTCEEILREFGDIIIATKQNTGSDSGVLYTGSVSDVLMKLKWQARRRQRRVALVCSGILLSAAVLTAAVVLFKTARRQPAERILAQGLSLEEGTGGITNLSAAVQCFRKAAEWGNAKAQTKLGSYYASGQAVESNATEAIRWYRKAADQGYADAQSSLGLCYEKGLGVEKDQFEAEHWYRKAAHQGYADAQLQLGRFYLRDTHMGQAMPEAMYWLRKAAEQGYVPAQNHLGFCFLYGFGGERSPTKQLYWYCRAADQGDTEAMLSLASDYRNGFGFQKDAAEAVRWYRKAAEHGDVRGHYGLAECYDLGEGVEQDLAEAARWLRKAADQGKAFYQHALGCYYESDKGVEQDPAEAARWFRKGAEQDFVPSQCRLGLCYYFGQGVEKNETEAVRWLRKATETAASESAENWGCYLRKASEGDAAAQLSLSLCHRYGLGRKKDKTEETYWLRKAAAQGDARAKRMLEEMGM